MALHNFYNYRNNTLFGFQTKHILLVLVGLGIYWYLTLKKGVSTVVTSIFGESQEEKKQKEEILKNDKVVIESTKKYGNPTNIDISLANRIFVAMDSFWGNDSEVIKAIGEVTGAGQMNRVFNAFGTKTIKYGFIGFRESVTGNLTTHIYHSKIDINKVHTRKDGSKYTIKVMLNHIGK